MTTTQRPQNRGASIDKLRQLVARSAVRVTLTSAETIPLTYFRNRVPRSIGDSGEVAGRHTEVDRFLRIALGILLQSAMRCHTSFVPKSILLDDKSAFETVNSAPPYLLSARKHFLRQHDAVAKLNSKTKPSPVGNGLEGKSISADGNLQELGDRLDFIAAAGTEIASILSLKTAKHAALAQCAWDDGRDRFLRQRFVTPVIGPSRPGDAMEVCT